LHAIQRITSPMGVMVHENEKKERSRSIGGQDPLVVKRNPKITGNVLLCVASCWTTLAYECFVLELLDCSIVRIEACLSSAEAIAPLLCRLCSFPLQSIVPFVCLLVEHGCIGLNMFQLQ